MGEPRTRVLQVHKVAIEGIWGFSEMSISVMTYKVRRSCSFTD
ncbi:hypothetical protein PLAN_40521 [Planktothrix rubescens CCAP 1459/22]|uniref:Uncharacterized protein n=1 Tax=Planktothrix rubescens CCAP 1459/22 TaxID=329571 RepID=A0A6J7ZNX9_PLARU|nr:hypothetical protein PLAN_40521 [Planktothrix rubescens NIVA-CYA 18]